MSAYVMEIYHVSIPYVLSHLLLYCPNCHNSISNVTTEQIVCQPLMATWVFFSLEGSAIEYVHYKR